jgi:hypothetical protein
MRQGDGTDLLGSSDPRSASIGVIYVDANDDRQSVLTAILTQDKLGFKQVVVVLPIQHKAFQRPVDFDGLKHMRRGLKAEIVFIAPSGPGPAEFARQRRFPVYSSLKSFSQAIKLETIVSGTANGSTKRGLFGFGRKQEVAATVAVASVSSSRIGEESTSPLPVNGVVNAPQEESYSPKSGQESDVAGEKNDSNGKLAIAPGLAAGGGLAALANDQNSSSTPEPVDNDAHALSVTDAEAQLNENTSSNGPLANGGREPNFAVSNGAQEMSDPGPGIITFSSNAPKPKTTRKFPVPPAAVAAVPVAASELSSQRNGSNTASPKKRSNTGKMAAVVGGATAMGVGVAKANSAASGGSLPPSGNSPVGPGGSGVGGTSRRTRIVLIIVLGILAVLLIGGIVIAAIPGGFNNITHIIPGTTTQTATVMITPDSQTLPNTYVIHAVTGIPVPAQRQVQARILTFTSQPQMKTVTSTGSIPALRATGPLQFYNLATSGISVSPTILTGADGVHVSFNGPFNVPAGNPVTVNGFAINFGTSGNIALFDINKFCCVAGNNIHVKNTGAFSGGQNAVPNSVVLQSDINGAADALSGSLTPGTQAALQKQVNSNEQVVPTTMQCFKSTFKANHAAGVQAPNVTVTVAITCKEEVYNQQAALAMAKGLLVTDPPPSAPGLPYALNTDPGAIFSEVVKVTVDKPTGIVTLNVKAQGVWVYQFDESTLTGFKNHISNMKNQDAIKYLKAQPGVSAVTIDNPNGDTLPDAMHINIVVVHIPVPSVSPTPGTATVTPGSPTVAPTQQKAPSPTPTQGLGGS